MRPDVVVVGGGVIGCAVAFFLAREGVTVTLLERGALAGEASGGAAGMLAPVAEAESEGPLLAWGLRSLEAFPALVAELHALCGVDAEYRPSGILRLAASEGQERALRAQAETLPDLGLEWLPADALRRAEPATASGLRGALLSPREAHVRSPLLVRAYAGAAARLGARLEEGTPVVGLRREGAAVVGVETPQGSLGCGAVVVCAGSWTRGLAAAIDLPVSPVRGQIVQLDAPSPPLGAILWTDEVYLVPKADGTVAVGATVEHVGFDRRVTAEGVRRLLAAAAGVVPALADAAFRGAWAGLRPDTPDHLPLVGPVPGAPGLFVAAGHYRNGVLLSPATGELVVDGLAGKGWREPAFLPARFAGPDG